MLFSLRFLLTDHPTFKETVDAAFRERRICPHFLRLMRGVDAGESLSEKITKRLK
jgi:hypothetical protein